MKRLGFFAVLTSTILCMRAKWSRGAKPPKQREPSPKESEYPVKWFPSKGGKVKSETFENERKK